MLNELTKPDDLIRLEKIKNNLQLRSKIIQEIRNYFFSCNFLETDTPVLIKSPAPEDYINAPKAGDFFLRSSPELHMKRMVASNYDKIFQIGSCFREGEIGKLHNVEFTMLEWYESKKDYNDLILFLKNLLLHVVTTIKGETKTRFRKVDIDFAKEWQIFTIREAFLKFTDLTAEEAIEKNLFELLLTEKIEPNLAKDRPVILKDYPSSMAALSKIDKKDGTAQRWELYLGAIEIANAYTELTDSTEQKERFKKVHNKRKSNKLPEYPEDEDFFQSLEYGIGPFGGCALGIDRLVMILTDSNNIKDVRSFI